ncbi:hypothetical protein SANA_25370 [Gottschalkiaceae bacterium SANA]|nr:hypothetical protein SANA_25370 [Gottschalkiaceae bacterium SANA]
MRNRDSRLIESVFLSGELQYGGSIEYEEIMKCIEDCKDDPENIKIYPYDCPDLVIELPNMILAIEHFIIDQSKLTRKGSQFKCKYNMNYYNKKHQKAKKMINKKNSVSSTFEIVSTPFKYEYFMENFREIFDDHYSKVDSYKERIRIEFDEKSKPIYTIFFIECDIKIPSHFQEGSRVEWILPQKDIEFFSYLEDKTAINGVLVYWNSNGWTKEIKQYCSIEAIRQGCYRVNNKDIFDLSGRNIIDSEHPASHSIRVESKED